MHETLPIRLGLCLFSLVLILLPASYMPEVVTALRTGRLAMDARGVRVVIVRAEQPRRLVVTITALLVLMALLTPVFVGIGVPALLAT